MKKTLVAIAAVIATTGAMAEVTISGAVDMALQSSNTDGTKTTSMFGASNENSNVAFRATDDIGNGLKSEAFIDMGLYSVNSGVSYTREMYVGLMGDFGSLHFGRKLDPLFLAFAANEVNGAPAGVGGNEGINSIVLVQGERDARRDNSVMWQSPEMNGVKVNAHWAAAGTDDTAAFTWGESGGWGVTYAAGGLNANYQWQRTALEAILDYTSTSTYAAVTIDGTTTRQVAALSYDLGAVKLAYTYANASNDSVTVNANYVGIAMPMGAITLSASMYNNTHVDSVNSIDASGSGNLFRANYAISKRTLVYAIYGSSTYDDATYVRRSIVGLSHSF